MRIISKWKKLDGKIERETMKEVVKINEVALHSLEIPLTLWNTIAIILKCHSFCKEQYFGDLSDWVIFLNKIRKSSHYQKYKKKYNNDQVLVNRMKYQSTRFVVLFTYCSKYCVCVFFRSHYTDCGILVLWPRRNLAPNSGNMES